jgi:hypothetical protein
MKTKILMALLAGSALLAACKGSGHYEVANTSSSADSASITQADTGAAPKLVKTAEIKFKVKNVVKTAEDISVLITKYNGMVTHHQMLSTVERTNDVRLNGDSVKRIASLSTSADMSVKVPAEKLEEFMNQVSHMGLYVSIRKMDIEDHTLDYLSNKMKLNSRQEIISAQKKGKVVIKHAADVLYLKDDMIDQQIGNKRINDAVKFSVVNLEFYQSNAISMETIANDDPSAYGLPFGTRMVLAINNGWVICKEIVIACTNLWALVLIGVLFWLTIRKYRQKTRANLPSSV